MRFTHALIHCRIGMWETVHSVVSGLRISRTVPFKVIIHISNRIMVVVVMMMMMIMWRRRRIIIIVTIIFTITVVIGR